MRREFFPSGVSIYPHQEAGDTGKSRGLRWPGTLFLAAFLLSPCSAGSQIVSPAGARAEIVRNIVIYESPGEYCAWPSIARTLRGELVVLFTRTEEHLGPDGALMLSRSSDDGRNWSHPVTVFDSPIDDRESGITTLRDGCLVGHFWSTLHTGESYAALAQNSYERDVIQRWMSVVEGQVYRDAANCAGARSAVSCDGGRTWSPIVRSHDSVHGGIQLSTGGLLVASYRETRDSITVNAADSATGPWRRIAVLTSPHPDSLGFCEPHMVQIRSGRVIMMIRATTHPYDDRDPGCVLWETYSDDNGRTWVAPFATSLWGYPPHMALLSDGKVLCTYGYRRPPYGERACISSDGLEWRLRDELIIRDDAPNGDLGYPASLELEPGMILTVYYQPDVPPGTIQRMEPPDPERTKPGILGTMWRVPGKR